MHFSYSRGVLSEQSLAVFSFWYRASAFASLSRLSINYNISKLQHRLIELTKTRQVQSGSTSIYQNQKFDISITIHIMESKYIWRIVKCLTWIAGLYLSAMYSFHTLYFIFSGFYLMFTNLGKREEGSLSAYSVFNKNFERLHGTMDGMSLFKSNPDVPQMVIQKKQVEKNEDDYKKQNEYFRNESKYGNKPCFCGSEVKFKKCCLPMQRARQQQQRLKRIKSK